MNSSQIKTSMTLKIINKTSCRWRSTRSTTIMNSTWLLRLATLKINRKHFLIWSPRGMISLLEPLSQRERFQQTDLVFPQVLHLELRKDQCSWKKVGWKVLSTCSLFTQTLQRKSNPQWTSLSYTSQKKRELSRNRRVQLLTYKRSIGSMKRRLSSIWTKS